MRQHLVFFHQNYPAQFGPIIPFLLQNYDVDISFFSEYITRPILDGISHYLFHSDKTGASSKPYFFSRYFEEEARSMYGAYKAFQSAEIRNPNVFIGHVGFGTLMFLHVSHPDVPSIGFFEYFYNPFNTDKSCRHNFPLPRENILRIPLRNATQLIELEYCTKAYSPTPYQKSTFPAAYQDKIQVLFDGVDTDLYQPGPVSNNSELKRTWPKDAKVITYVSRGLESQRGFDIFMEMAYRLCQQRNDVHFVIAGNPKTHYGSEGIFLKGQTFKDYVLSQHPFDLSRFHFLDWISEPALADLFRLSHCHFYWTVPFTLSWSFFQAMASGTLIMASNTEPVRDVLQHSVNGLLVDPYDIDAMVDQAQTILDAPQQYQSLRQAARDTIVEYYSFSICLPQLAQFYLGLS